MLTTEIFTFTCSICSEPSHDICVLCTKDACRNHRCTRCKCCSDCCACDSPLSEAETSPEPMPVQAAQHLEMLPVEFGEPIHKPLHEAIPDAIPDAAAPEGISREEASEHRHGPDHEAPDHEAPDNEVRDHDAQAMADFLERPEDSFPDLFRSETERKPE